MTRPIHVLLADDDEDDRFFFNLALQKQVIPTQLSVVEDGEKLIQYLSKKSRQLPDVLFLDLNMPRKNGAECLEEIKRHARWKNLPVIIHSTSVQEDVSDILYNNGAHYYNRKTNTAELQKVIFHVLTLITEKKLARPARDQFVLSWNQVPSTSNFN